MTDRPDIIELLLVSILMWWHGAAVVAVVQAAKSFRAKFGWILAIVLLPPFGLGAWLVRGRKRGLRYLGVTGYFTISALLTAILLGLTREYWPGFETFAWIAAWSVVTFVMYAVDKLAVQQGTDARGRSVAPRVNESALHLFALLGGFVGGWLGRHVLRHKTNKPVFGVVLVFATVLHLSKIFGLW